MRHWWWESFSCHSTDGSQDKWTKGKLEVRCPASEMNQSWRSQQKQQQWAEEGTGPVFRWESAPHINKGVAALRDVFSHSWPINRSLSHIWTSAMRPHSVSYLVLKNACLQKTKTKKKTTRKKGIKICQDCFESWQRSMVLIVKFTINLKLWTTKFFFFSLNFEHLVLCLLYGFWLIVTTRQLLLYARVNHRSLVLPVTYEEHQRSVCCRVCEASGLTAVLSVPRWFLHWLRLCNVLLEVYKSDLFCQGQPVFAHVLQPFTIQPSSSLSVMLSLLLSNEMTLPKKQVLSGPHLTMWPI